MLMKQLGTNTVMRQQTIGLENDQVTKRLPK